MTESKRTTVELCQELGVRRQMKMDNPHDIKIMEDRLRRKLRHEGLLLRKSRKDGTYVIVNGQNGVEGGPGMSLEQVVAFSNEPPTLHLGREAIKQEIAKMMYGRFKIAEVVGAPSGIVVKAHDDTNRNFLEATLAPDADIVDSFALRLFCKHESEYLVEEQDVSCAGKQAQIAHEKLKEDRVPVLDDKSTLIKACKIARAKSEEVALSRCDGWTFEANDIQWAMRKSFDTCFVHPKGVVIMTVRGVAGRYWYYLRGHSYDPPEVAQAA